MYNQNSFSELIDGNHLYRLLGQKLDIPQNFYNKPIDELCLELNLNADLIQTLLKSYDVNLEFPFEELNSFSIAELVNYLKLTHRFYLYKKLPEIEQSILQVFNNYNDTHQMLIQMCHYFVEFKNKLIEHIKFEEKELFPYIQKLVELNSESSKDQIQTVLKSFSFTTFLESHTNIEDDLQLVRKTILQHSEFENKPLPYRLFLSQIEHFEIDLCKHALIEDNVLMKKVVELEEKFSNVLA